MCERVCTLRHTFLLYGYLPNKCLSNPRLLSFLLIGNFRQRLSFKNILHIPSHLCLLFASFALFFETRFLVNVGTAFRHLLSSAVSSWHHLDKGLPIITLTPMTSLVRWGPGRWSVLWLRALFSPMWGGKLACSSPVFAEGPSVDHYSLYQQKKKRIIDDGSYWG